VIAARPAVIAARPAGIVLKPAGFGLRSVVIVFNPFEFTSDLV
jgi:hypothetical protein